MATAVWWIRRDLRLTDNQALSAALNGADEIVPLFIIDPFFQTSPYVSRNRLAFLYASLRELNARLNVRSSRLIIRRGRPENELAKIVAETGAVAIHAEQDYSNYGRRRDAAIQKTLPLHLESGIVVHHPDSLLKTDGTPYQLFTPFKKKAWLARPLPRPSHILPAPQFIPTPAELLTYEIPNLPRLLADAPFPPGETQAQRRLAAFVNYPFTQLPESQPPHYLTPHPPIYLYAHNRDRLDLNGTSRLSPYLRFGLISARQAAVAAIQSRESAGSLEARRGADTFLSELIWREFYYSILYHFPHVAQGSFRPEYDHIEWRNDPAEFAAWCAGQTGYPVVDAAMRQLAQTGWMHNRARMIVASFLVKDLLIDWRWGERFFMRHLIDGEPANNNGGWQWVAGTGTDAAPYFRIFNPSTQSKKFDPDGAYIRRWLPELAHLPGKTIHIPWKLPPAEQEKLNFKIGRDYPGPIVDHQLVRDRTLAAFKEARKIKPDAES